MHEELAKKLAALFIARPDVKAEQFGPTPNHPKGGYMPVEGKFTKADLIAHLSGEKTYGHYVVNPADGKCKLFCFDIDLNAQGTLPNESGELVSVTNLREAWHNRAHPGRNYMKSQFYAVAYELSRRIQEMLELPCAVAYSGNKGIHVYGFTGRTDAWEAREGAKFVLEDYAEFAARNESGIFYDPIPGSLLSNLSIEVYPKQSELDGKQFGNLLRLPLGRNIKHATDPTFFVDMTSANGMITPVDSLWALTTPDIFAEPVIVA